MKESVIRKIIKEELIKKNKQLNENAYSTNIFTTEVTGLEVDLNFDTAELFGLDNNTNYDTSAVLTVKWGVEMEMREWGVKSIYTIIHSVEGGILVNEWTDDRDIEHEFSLEELALLNKAKWGRANWEIEDNIEVDSGTIQVENVELDFRKGIIFVT